MSQSGAQSQRCSGRRLRRSVQGGKQYGPQSSRKPHCAKLRAPKGLLQPRSTAGRPLAPPNRPLVLPTRATWSPENARNRYRPSLHTTPPTTRKNGTKSPSRSRLPTHPCPSPTAPTPPPRNTSRPRRVSNPQPPPSSTRPSPPGRA